MLKACVPDLLCDAEDILLLEEIGPAQEFHRKQLTRERTFDEVSVRLIEVKGNLCHRRLAGGNNNNDNNNNNNHWSLDDVRIVAAILKDSEIVLATPPSNPLRCTTNTSTRTTSNSNLNVSFRAGWGAQGITLSFDRHSNEKDSVELVIALVNANNIEMDDSFLLACPCGDASLWSLRHGNRGLREMSVRPRPSPRHYVLFPVFSVSDQDADVIVVPSREKSGLGGSNRKEEEKSTKSNEPDELELPYLSLQNSTVSFEVSWKIKELDVEVCYAGEDSATSNYQPLLANGLHQVIIDERKNAYLPTRVRRDALASAESVDTQDTIERRERHEESPISVVVNELDSLARQQGSSMLACPKASVRRDVEKCWAEDSTRPADETKISAHSKSPLLNDIMKALDEEFNQDNAVDDHKRPLLSHVSTLSDTKRNISAKKEQNRSTSEITIASSSNERWREDTITEEQPSQKPKRLWSGIIRKPRSVRSARSKDSATAEPLRTAPEDSLLKEVSSSPEEQKSDTLPRKRIFSPFRSKSMDRKGAGTSVEKESSCIAECSESEANTPECSESEDNMPDRHDPNPEARDHVHQEVEEKSLLALSTPTIMNKKTPEKFDEDTVGAVHFLSSLCTTGTEVLPANKDAAAPPGSPEPKRQDSQTTKQSTGVTWVSHESVEGRNKSKPALSEIVAAGSLCSPPSLCATVSDVTMDYSFQDHHSLEKIRSLESKISSGEITTLTKIEDRILQTAYHGCGGRQLDQLTDAILRNSPGIVRRWLDLESTTFVESGDESVYSNDTDMNTTLSLNSVDFERATTAASRAASQALSRQLTTITEESESRGLHAQSSSDDPGSTGQQGLMRKATLEECEQFLQSTASF